LCRPESSLHARRAEGAALTGLNRSATLRKLLKMNVKLSDETSEYSQPRREEGSRGTIAYDAQSLLARLHQTTLPIKRWVFIALGVVTGWISLKCIITFTPALRNDYVVRSSLLGLMLLVFAAITFAQWRLAQKRSHEEQENILREMLVLAQSEPLGLERIAPQLKLLSHRWSPTYGDNHLLAREIVDRVEQARGAERSLPIAHETPEKAGDTLPRIASGTG
jgi:hypothetical protein